MSTETKKLNDTQAFPRYGVDQYGMTLRDYFANSAMQGHLASEYYVIGSDFENKLALAKQFYEFADAMLKQREL